MDAQTIAAQAESSAKSSPARKAATSNYTDVFGPVETTGGHGDAYITRSPSGVDYVEYRPHSGGRIKRAPLTAVTALFPAIARKPRAPRKPAAESADKK